jgi:hypothetical protein
MLTVDAAVHEALRARIAAGVKRVLAPARLSAVPCAPEVAS